MCKDEWISLADFFLAQCMGNVGTSGMHERCIMDQVEISLRYCNGEKIMLQLLNVRSVFPSGINSWMNLVFART